MKFFRIALAQINNTVGDINNNSQKIIKAIHSAQTCGSHMIAFPELTISGYPPEDLLLNNNFLIANQNALEKIKKETNEIVAVVGYAEKHQDHTKLPFNSAAIIAKNKIVANYQKIVLPNYGVFDEQRYFTPGSKSNLFICQEARIGINICEDIWDTSNTVENQCSAGANILININASPYEIGKIDKRESIAKQISKKFNVYMLYVNQVGGQDELVFDGSSFIIDKSGILSAKATSFAEKILYFDIPVENLRNSITKKSRATTKLKEVKLPSIKPRKNKKKLTPERPVHEPEIKQVYEALVLGTHDYVKKTGFSKSIIAISGGIDSALTASIAVDALDNNNVIGVAMPSRFSSIHSIEDAQKLCDNLRIDLLKLNIEEIHKSYENSLNKYFKDHPENQAEENIQARIRSTLIMALSNKFNILVLTTGNKSETAVGYTTLYGDMAGGFSVLKDISKTLVYSLANYRNSISKVIPQDIILKPPSAELKANQKDQDSLPDYEILDIILEKYIENNHTPPEIWNGLTKFQKKLTSQKEIVSIIKSVDQNEYKRRQSAPGIKITPLAFGKDRRLPIAHKFNLRK